MWKHQHRTAYERLLRRLLKLPQQPAVLLLNHYAYVHAEGRYYYAMGKLLRVSSWVANCGLRMPSVCVCMRAEDHVNVLASYYGVPSLSMRDAIWPLILANVSGYYTHLSGECLPPQLDPIKYCENMRNAWTAAGGNLSAVDKNSLLYYGAY